MPERPDLEYFVPILDREVKGLGIAGVRVDKPVVLRVALRDPVTVIVGRTIAGVRRRAHFVCFSLATGNPEGVPQTAPAVASPALEIVVAPMLAGRFTLAQPKDRKPADLALTLELSDGRELRYRDDVQMGKVYVIQAGAETQVPGLATIGVDVLDKKLFTKARFRAIAKTRRDQVKVFLMDKSALDAMGNAYADEVLFEARLHPKTFVRSLGPDELDRLHDAIVSVLGDARAEVAKRKPPIDEKIRDFLKVRNRHGDKCPRCGTTIRKAGVHGHDAFFCPECQPDDRKSAIVDFRRAKS
jgi:formamidopyrimidine-DNA glycosylase